MSQAWKGILAVSLIVAATCAAAYPVVVAPLLHSRRPASADALPAATARPGFTKGSLWRELQGKSKPEER